jgi:hypothetical protein
MSVSRACATAPAHPVFETHYDDPTFTHSRHTLGCGVRTNLDHHIMLQRCREVHQPLHREPHQLVPLQQLAAVNVEEDLLAETEHLHGQQTQEK